MSMVFAQTFYDKSKQRRLTNWELLWKIIFAFLAAIYAYKF